MVKKNHGSKKEIWLPQYRKAAKKPSGLTFPPRLALEDFDTSPKTNVKWDELRAEFLDRLSAIDEEQLVGTIDWELLSHGLKSTSPRWEILHHHFRVQTVEQDMILYLAEQKKTI